MCFIFHVIILQNVVNDVYFTLFLQWFYEACDILAYTDILMTYIGCLWWIQSSTTLWEDSHIFMLQHCHLHFITHFQYIPLLLPYLKQQLSSSFKTWLSSSYTIISFFMVTGKSWIVLFKDFFNAEHDVLSKNENI